MMLNSYNHSVSFLQKKVPLDNMIVASTYYPNPKSRKSKNTVKQVEFLAKQFPDIIDETHITQLNNEWKYIRQKITTN